MPRLTSLQGLALCTLAFFTPIAILYFGAQ